MRIPLLVLALALSLSLNACPKHQAAPSPPLKHPAKQLSPNVPPPTPAAYVIFVPPPEDPLRPERAFFNAEFSKAAQEVFPANNWSYKEVELSKNLFSEWEGIMYDAMSDTPTIIFSYDNTYVSLLTALAKHTEKRVATYVFILSTVREDESSLVKVLEPRTEELGFLAGAALARMTRTAHLATVTYETYEGDRFVAGFYQGASEERGAVTHSAVYVKREDLIGAEESALLISGKLATAAKRYKGGLGIDGIALFIGQLAEPFVQALPPTGVYVACGPVPMDEPMHGVLTSVYVDFGKIPQYLVDHAEDLELLVPKVPFIPKEGVGLGGQLTPGGLEKPARTQYISVGLAEGILNFTGLSQYGSKHDLPEGLEQDLERYSAAIISGEFKVSPEKPE